MVDEREKKMKTVIAFGSNMGDRQAYIDQALDLLEERAGRILALSDVIETKAYGRTDQADFLNGAVVLETDLPPRGLLQVLHGIEADLDRVRTIRWGPRTIDLDIILYGDEIVDMEDLHIPHVDFTNRQFVLAPLDQIVPGWIDPRSYRTVHEIYEDFRKGQEDGSRVTED